MRNLLVVAALALLLTGCETARQDNALGGALIGGAAGGIIGGVATNSVGGALAGGVIGPVVKKIGEAKGVIVGGFLRVVGNATVADGLSRGVGDPVQSFE